MKTQNNANSIKKNQSLKRILAFIIIITAVIIASCTKNDTDDDMPTTATTSTAHEEIIIVPEGTVRILPNLPDYPDIDWEYETGHTLRIIVSDLGAFGELLGMVQPRDIVAEEETGDAINDAVYRRNMALEEKYNFTVEQVLSGNIDAALRTAVASGDNYFDIFTAGMNQVGSNAQAGYFVDLFAVNYLDFEKPWWNQGAMAAMSIGNRLFLTSGDFTLVNRDLAPAILFNKQLIANLELEDPYELVRKGQWTLGKITEMAREATTNTANADWQSDRFGFLSNFGNWSLRYGAGLRISEKDEDDLPVLVYENERTFRILDAVNELMSLSNSFNPPWSLNASAYLDYPQLAFAEGRVLFLNTHIRTVETLRGMDTDFGILPIPWLDEHQHEWRHCSSSTNSLRQVQTMAIPTFHSGEGLDRIGFMLEAVSAESRYTVIPAHYDVQLTGKFVRDDDSLEMLDIIFGSVVWDTSDVYGWFRATSLIDENGNNASHFERIRNMIEGLVQQTVDTFKNIG